MWGGELGKGRGTHLDTDVAVERGGDEPRGERDDVRGGLPRIAADALILGVPDELALVGVDDNA